LALILEIAEFAIQNNLNIHFYLLSSFIIPYIKLLHYIIKLAVHLSYGVSQTHKKFLFIGLICKNILAKYNISFLLRQMNKSTQLIFVALFFLFQKLLALVGFILIGMVKPFESSV
jgi:hypothetical protein